jgi:transposase
VKTVEQQALRTLHRVRTQRQVARTARINVMRGVLREHGLPIGVGARVALTRITAMLDNPGLAFPFSVRHNEKALR